MLYWQLFWTFLKIGALSFGGGMAMLPLIQQEMAATGWITAAEVTDIVALSQMTPGPLAINAATFAGTRAGGIPGALAATVGVTLPSLILSLLAARFFFAVRDSKLVRAGMTGIRPAVAGMVGATALNMLFLTVAGSELPGLLNGAAVRFSPFALLLAALTFFLLWRKVSPVLLIVLSGAAGVLRYVLEQNL